MKKLLALLISVLILTACSGNVALDAEGDVGIDLLPGESEENGTQTEQQAPPPDNILHNPLVIVLLALVVLLVVMLAFTMGRRTP